MDSWVGEIQQNIADSETNQAILKLKEVLKNKTSELYNQVLVLESQLKENANSIKLNLISFDEYNRNIARINYGILKIVNEYQKELKSSIILSQTSCSTCGPQPEKTTIKVKSIQSEETSWFAKGEGRLSNNLSCPNCAAYLNAVEENIPIHCGSYKCPSCGENENWEYQVKKINTRALDFDFEVRLECIACKKERILKTAVNNPKEVIGIKVEANQIEVDRNN